MINVRVIHSLDDFEDDLRNIAIRAPKDIMGVVREGVKVGNSVAKDNARRTAGRHGKHYHKAFSWEMTSPFFGFGVGVFSGEYGPDISKPQGGMSFEHGSRNQKPHLDLAKSADLIGPALAQEVRALPDRWFWPS